VMRDNLHRFVVLMMLGLTVRCRSLGIGSGRHRPPNRVSRRNGRLSKCTA